MKYYAVRKGRVPGIYRSWTLCKTQVEGYQGAEFKSFYSAEEAKDYLENATPKRKITDTSKYDLVAYVDGSCTHDGKQYASGVVLLDNSGRVIAMESVRGTNPDYVQMRNVAGEILAASYVMSYAANHNLRNIAIYYDYEGIEKWCTGEWTTRKLATHQYRIDYLAAQKSKIHIDFQKVKSHSNDLWNDIADGLAKMALGMICYEDILTQIIDSIHSQCHDDKEFLESISEKMKEFIYETELNDDYFKFHLIPEGNLVYKMRTY